jgi:succinate dehydrogenase/fumarate reductase flavoprotein subunit
MRLSYMITRTCRAGLYAGGEFNQSYLKWGSSGTSNLYSFGPVAGIAIGWEM